MTTFADQAMVLKVTAYSVAQADQIDAPVLPGGDIDDIAFTWSWAPATTTTYPAATIGRSTAPTDTPANTYVPGALSDSVNYGISILSAADPVAGGGSSTAGEILLIDPGGSLDALTGTIWDGATIEILRGDPLAAFSTYSTVASFTGAGLVYDTKAKQIKLRDINWRLTQGLIHDERYSGAGGTDGDATLANVWKPICYGSPFNITPVQIGASLLIYQVSFTTVQAISAVRDGGAALTLDTAVGTAGDCATYAALAAATVAAGKYATCLAKGLFRLGGSPTKRITCDAQGDNESIGGVTWASKRADIVQRIATGRGNVKLTTAQLDTASFAALNTAQAAACEAYFSQPISKADAIRYVLDGCLGYAAVTVAGLLTVGYFDETPTTASTVFKVPSAGQVAGDCDVVGEPTMQAIATPRRSTFLGWSRNYTPQTQDELAGSVSMANAAIYAADSRKVSVTNGSLVVAQPTAPIVTLESGMASQADALVEVARQQRVMSKRRELWQIDVRLDPYTALLGQAVEIGGWTRFKFGGARVLKIVGINVTGANRITLTLWG